MLLDVEFIPTYQDIRRFAHVKEWFISSDNAVLHIKDCAGMHIVIPMIGVKRIEAREE